MYSSSNREQTIESYIKYADKIAYLFVKKTGLIHLREDIKSVAYEGLIKAIDTFDSAKGSLLSYIYKKTNFEILNFMRNNDYLSRVQRKDVKNNGDKSIFQNIKHISIDDCLHLYSNINIEDIYFQKENKKILYGLIYMLPEKYKHIMVEYILNHKTMKEIGIELSVTESRISQICEKACYIIKRNFKKMEENKTTIGDYSPIEINKDNITTPVPNEIVEIPLVTKERRCKCGDVLPPDRKVGVCFKCWGKQRHKPKQVQENKKQQEDLSKLKKTDFIILSFEKDHSLAEDIKVIAQAERRSVEDQILFFLEESCNNFIETREQWNKYALLRSKV